MLEFPQATPHLIVGAGFAGIAAAKSFSDEGFSYIHIEKELAPGGTWWKNNYPGLSCDVPSGLYSYSFADCDYSRTTFAKGYEIQAYLKKIVHDYLPYNSIHYGAEMLSMHWDPHAQYWIVATSRGTITADNVILATGLLDEPKFPDIPGLESYSGYLTHTATWDDCYDLRGKAIGIIGTGASGIQVIPQVAKIAHHLTVFQRSACWVLPKFERRISKWERILGKFSFYRKIRRLVIYIFRELQVIGFTRFSLVLRLLEIIANINLRYYIRDQEMRKKLTPDYTLGCKRILLSNQYFKTYRRDNISLETSRIATIEGSKVFLEDGKAIDLDVLIVATGYNVSTPVVSNRISIPTATGSLTLKDFWEQNGAIAYWGTSVLDFPNFFLISGPGTAIGHTSMVYMIEKQLRYILKKLRENHHHSNKVYRISEDEFHSYNKWFRGRLSKTVWTQGGCSSWYLGADGKGPGVWPTWTFRFNPKEKSTAIKVSD